MRHLADAGLDFHRAASLWAVTEEKHALPARAVVYTASGLAPRDRPLHQDAAQARPGARFVYADACEKHTLINRAVLAGGRVAAVEACEEDPEGVLSAAAEAGADPGRPLSVHVLFAPQRWPGWLARQVLLGYRRLLAPGSSVCLTLGAAAPGPEGDALVAAVAAVAGPVYRHDRTEVAGWFADAGLDLHPLGVTDARVFGRPGMRQQIEALRPPARVTEAVGIVPWRS